MGPGTRLLFREMTSIIEEAAVTATSKKPTKEGQPPAPNINPLLLMSARMGSWEALNVLLEREATNNPAIMIPTKEFLDLLARDRSAQGGIAVPAARDVEEGVDHQDTSVAAGALLKGVTPDGDTALHAVASKGDGEHFLRYAGIIYDRNRGLLFQKNHKGGTPLHCAARAGNSKMVSHLIDLAGREGADRKLGLLRMENKRHETALHEAVRFEDAARTDLAGEEKNKHATVGAPEEEKSIVKLLMGADPELARYPEVGVSPLYLAILLGKKPIALTLYDMSGGNLSYSGADGQNALHLAVLRDPVMIDFLVHWNKRLTTQVDKDGSTPLHFASSMSTVSYRFACFFWTSPLMLHKVYEANPTALYQADKDGSFPIHVAAYVGDRGAIRFFHHRCMDSVGLRDAKGRTFLHVAVEKRKLDIVSYVCRTSCLAWILNMQDNDGNTALHLAIQARSFRMFCALFGNLEVKLNLANNHGETPGDMSRNKLPRGLYYGQNSEHKIFMVLRSVGVNHGALRCDKTEERYSRDVKLEEDKESEMLRNAAQALIIASVLIATVAFSATFALPGGYRADDHTNGGTPTLAGSYVFDAFMMATTLAFICSSMATVGFVFAATPMLAR